MYSTSHGKTTKDKLKEMKPVNSPHKKYTFNNLQLTQELPLSTKNFRKKHAAMSKVTIHGQRHG
jgi:hypothetical protein